MRWSHVPMLESPRKPAARCKAVAKASWTASAARSRSRVMRRAREYKRSPWSIRAWDSASRFAGWAGPGSPETAVIAARPPRGSRDRGGREAGVDELPQVAARKRSEPLVDRAPVPEEDERGNRLDAVTLGEVRVLVHVHLGDGQPAFIVLRHGIEGRGQPATGRAPRGPEVHQ